MNKRCLLLTGASSDIGCSFLRLLAPEQWKVIAHYHSNLAPLQAIQREAPLELLPIPADLSSPVDIERFLSAVDKISPCPDVIVHMAAPKLEIHRFQDIPDFSKHTEIQCLNVVPIFQHFLPRMAKRGGQVIFVLSSVVENHPPKGMADYVVGKYALLGLVRALTAEYENKIHIDSISPTMTDTKFLSEIPDWVKEQAALDSPRKRHLTPNEVATNIHDLLKKHAV